MNKVINLACAIFIPVAVFLWPPRCSIDNLDVILAIKLLSGDIETVRRRIDPARHARNKNKTKGNETKDDDIW